MPPAVGSCHRSRASLIYILIVVAVGLGIFAALQIGASMAPPHAVKSLSVAAHTEVGHSLFSAVRAALWQNASNPLGRLLLQLLVIIAASRLAGWAVNRCGQPAVVGEMIAGILLGPSLFGLLAPGAFQFVFSATSLGALQLFSQIGVCFFMFAMGMELDVAHVRNNARTAVVVSHASIVIPYFLGVVLALFLYKGFAHAGASFMAFSLFMGISMSITAFPVMARILQERGLARTPLGSTAMTCAAVDDVTAWSLLACVVAVVRSTSVAAAAFILIPVLIFLALMLWVIKPGLPRWLSQDALKHSAPTKGVLAVVVAVVLASALTTELIGIHALFGAFLAGAIMPDVGGFRHKLKVRVENFSSVLFLPLFFAFTGLRTQIGLLDDLQGWLICLGIVAVATAGKLGGGAVTARLTGLPWSESLQLGALMNTRGLMELIALNLGYDLGILSPRIFTMLVIMALVTTAMTGPLLTLFQQKARMDADPIPAD